MSKSSSKIGPLNDSAVGIVYLQDVKRDRPGVATIALPFWVLQFLHATSVAPIRQEFEI